MGMLQGRVTSGVPPLLGQGTGCAMPCLCSRGEAVPPLGVMVVMVLINRDILHPHDLASVSA